MTSPASDRSSPPETADRMLAFAQIDTECAGAIDYVVPLGDNADSGQPAQYALAATAPQVPRVPFHVIPGDHNREQGSLDAGRR